MTISHFQLTNTSIFYNKKLGTYTVMIFETLNHRTFMYCFCYVSTLRLLCYFFNTFLNLFLIRISYNYVIRVKTNFMKPIHDSRSLSVL